MKKILLALLILTTLSFAGYFEDGLKAYNAHEYTKAAELYQKASDQGVAGAQYNLLVSYYEGLGLRQSDTKAKELFGKDCDSGIEGGYKGYAILNKEVKV